MVSRAKLVEVPIKPVVTEVMSNDLASQKIDEDDEDSNSQERDGSRSQLSQEEPEQEEASEAHNS